MKELTVSIQDEYEWKVIYRTKLYTEEEYKKLEEENRKLKDKLTEVYRYENIELEVAWKRIEELEQENKKLKSDLAYERTMLDNVKAEYENLQEINKKLNERIRFLEQCLDNKEKVNISLR